MQTLPPGPEPDDQGGPSAHVGDADVVSTADGTRLAADRVGVLDIMSGDLRGSTAFSAACFGPACSSKASPSPVQPHLTALARPTLPGIHTFGPLPPNPHPRYDDYYLSKDVSPALHLSSAVGPHQGPLAIIPSRHLTGVWGNPDIPIARLGAAIRDVIRDRRAES